MRFHPEILVGLLGSSALVQSSCIPAANRTNITVALVRAPPPNWPMPLLSYDYTGITFNISQTVDAGVNLIEQAGASGANVITFPELWFPGFPKGHGYKEFNFTRDYLPSYIENTITIGDSQWQRLVAASRKAGIYSQINFAEREGDHMYMAQSLISPRGELVHHRRKLRPSGGERWMFSDGDISEVRAFQTSWGRWGMLECGEHFYASVLFAMLAQKEHLHFAPFPYLADLGDQGSLFWENEWIETGAVASYSFRSGAYSLCAAIGVSFVTDPLGNRVAHMSADADFEEFPILYHSYDTSMFDDERRFDINGEASWGVLSQIMEGFPDYIPRVQGQLVTKRNVSLAYLSTGNLEVTEDTLPR